MSFMQLPEDIIPGTKVTVEIDGVVVPDPTRRSRALITFQGATLLIPEGSRLRRRDAEVPIAHRRVSGLSESVSPGFRCGNPRDCEVPGCTVAHGDRTTLAETHGDRTAFQPESGETHGDRTTHTGLVAHLGDEEDVLYLEDDITPADIRELLTELQRRVLIARLLYWAEVLT